MCSWTLISRTQNPLLFLHIPKKLPKNSTKNDSIIIIEYNSVIHGSDYYVIHKKKILNQ